MKTEPIILEDIPRPGGPVLERHYGGWYALIVMFALMLANAVHGSIDRSKDAKFSEFDDQLKSIVQQAQVKKGSDVWLLAAADQADTKQDLRDLAKEMEKRKDLDTFGTAIYAAVLTEEKQPVPRKVYQVLEKGKMDATRAMGTVYSSPTLSLAQARSLVKRIRTNSLFVAKLAEIQALEKAGDKGARSRLLPQRSFSLALVLGGGMLLLLMGCVMAWFGYFAARSSGFLIAGAEEWRHHTRSGGPSRHSRRAAFRCVSVDQFAHRVGVQRVSSVSMGRLTQGVAVLAFVCLLPAIPLDNGKLSFEALGISRENLGKNILWGVVGFMAELPVAMVLAAIVTMVLKFLPTPEHPASKQLEQNHDPLAVISILVLGTIVAPIWEEIMFRGLLFPALSKVFRSVPLGAIVSSLVFASIHPQGAALWLALGTTGLMSCALSYQTRSLVPSIVMHFCHNMTLMVLTILMS